MIQRIQSLYLAIATALSALLLQGPVTKLIDVSGNLYELDFKGIHLILEDGTASMAEKTLPLTIILILIPVLFFISIFLFKNRKLQIRLTVLSTLLLTGSFLLILFYVFYTGNKLEADLIFTVKLVFPIIGAICGYLAFRATLKDELLIKSYDRIR